MRKLHIRSIIIIFLTGVVVFFSCKKDNPTTVNQAIQGTINLEVHAVHHNWDVSGIMIYLKINATEFPGKDSSKYEYKGISDGYGKFTFEHLFPGNYYVYASGFDSVWGSNVIGYLPVKLDKNTVTNNYFSLLLYVSE